jgi:hypothetical protein
MPQEPKSRPEPGEPPERKLNPQPPESVYGHQWGSSGKQNLENSAGPPPPEPPAGPCKRN